MNNQEELETDLMDFEFNVCLDDLQFEQFASDMFVFESRKYYVIKNSEAEEYLSHLSKSDEKEPLAIGYVYLEEDENGIENLKPIPNSEYEKVAKHYLMIKKAFSGVSENGK